MPRLRVRDGSRWRASESERETCLQYVHFWERLLLRPQQRDFEPRISSSNVIYPPRREIDSLLWIQVKATIPQLTLPIKSASLTMGRCRRGLGGLLQKYFFKALRFVRSECKVYVKEKALLHKKSKERCKQDAGLLQAARIESRCICTSETHFWVKNSGFSQTVWLLHNHCIHRADVCCCSQSEHLY